jgi:tetratricopeptide (TPR) repeat protein
MMSKNSDDIDFEIQFYEKTLKESPEFIEAMMALADLYTKKGLYREGLQLDERLARLRPDDPMVFYNLACSYSLVNNPYAALNAAKKAIEFGYDDFDYLVNDPDLANLLGDKEFLKYLKDAQKKQRKSSSKTVKE